MAISKELMRILIVLKSADDVLLEEGSKESDLANGYACHIAWTAFKHVNRDEAITMYVSTIMQYFELMKKDAKAMSV